jgi:hypothetical protein
MIRARNARSAARVLTPRSLIFGAALIVLGTCSAVFRTTIGYAAVGAVAATGIWIYFSLRDANLERPLVQPTSI